MKAVKTFENRVESKNIYFIFQVKQKKVKSLTIFTNMLLILFLGTSILSLVQKRNFLVESS